MTNPPDTAFDAYLLERWGNVSPGDYGLIVVATKQARRWTLANDPLVRQMAACLASINVQQIVNGKSGQELRATEISEILKAYRQACEGKT